jgi:hypothetical protein
MIILLLLDAILRVENPGKTFWALMGVPMGHRLTRVCRALGFKTPTANLIRREAK